MYDWKSFTIAKGAHDRREDGMCIMECVAYIADEEHSDHPDCACPICTSIAIGANDSYDFDDLRRNEALLPFVFRLAGSNSKGSLAVRHRMCVDFSHSVLAKYKGNLAENRKASAKWDFLDASVQNFPESAGSHLCGMATLIVDNERIGTRRKVIDTLRQELIALLDRMLSVGEIKEPSMKQIERAKELVLQ